MTENLPFSIHQFDLAFPAHLNYVTDPGSSEYGIKSWWPICYQDFGNSVCHYHWAEGWIPHSEWLNLTVIAPKCQLEIQNLMAIVTGQVTLYAGRFFSVNTFDYMTTILYY